MPASLASQRWADIPSEPVAAGVHRKYVTGDRLTVAQFELTRGASVPRHAHESEQVTQVITGSLKFAIDGREVIVRAGDVLQIPGWIEHEVEALEDTFVIDVFSPARQDWVDKTDNYFRR